MHRTHTTHVTHNTSRVLVVLVGSVDVHGEDGVRATALRVHRRRRRRAHGGAICQALEHVDGRLHHALGQTSKLHDTYETQVKTLKS